MQKARHLKSEGYGVLELLFYIAIFSALSLVVINSIITMTKSFRETAVHAELVQSAGIMERISREIRQASGINSIGAGFLKLDTTDENGVSQTVEFSSSGTNIRLLENDVFVGNLNSPNIEIGSISFAEITTAKGKAVKILLTLKSKNDTLGRTENFYDTVVLRGDY